MQYPFLGPCGQKSADILGLSMKGAVAICPFPEEAHHACFDKIATALLNVKNPVQTPIKLYVYLCNQYCTTNNIERDYSLINKYTEQYKINVSDVEYLPENERVKVEFNTDKIAKKKLPTPWPEPKLYRYSAMGSNRKFDNIAEAIKAHAYVAAGLQGLGFIEMMYAFEARALLEIAGMVSAGKRYVLDLPVIIYRIDEMIEFTVHESHHNFEHIKSLSVEDSQCKAHRAVAEYTPTLLKHFSC